MKEGGEGKERRVIRREDREGEKVEGGREVGRERRQRGRGGKGGREGMCREGGREVGVGLHASTKRHWQRVNVIISPIYMIL